MPAQVMPPLRMDRNILKAFRLIALLCGLGLIMMIVHDLKTNEAVHHLRDQMMFLHTVREEMFAAEGRNYLDQNNKDRMPASHFSLDDKRFAGMKEMYPQLFRSNSGKMDVASVRKINDALINELGAAANLENSRLIITRMFLCVVMIMLLLSILIMYRISRRYQEHLLARQVELIFQTEQLNRINQNLDALVEERTQELALAQYHVQQAEKLAAVGQLAAGIAHEINNPLGFINSNMQTLDAYLKHYQQAVAVLDAMRQASNPDEQRKALKEWDAYVEKVNMPFVHQDASLLMKESRQGVDKIKQIIMHLKSLASQEKEKTEYISLESLVDNMIVLVHNHLKYKTQVFRHYQPLPMIQGHVQRLSQVFMHLLMNAANAIATKGSITIRLYQKDQYACVDIQDTGEGMTPDIVTKIFDPFFTTRSPGEGMGLGLSLSYDIIKKHGGQLLCASRPKEGSTFTVMLPL